MSYHPDDTIVAIASAPGGAARGIVRVSGAETPNLVAARFIGDRREDIFKIASATALAGLWKTDDFQQPLASSVYIWPNARSFTREPLAEIHTLGAPPLLDAVVRSLCNSGARLAEPGEFTLRAFLAGRIDLTQAEAVLGVIDARGQSQLNSALAQLAGGLSAPLNDLRNSLLDMLAHLEAGLDFVEEDIEFISQADLLAQLDAAIRSAGELLSQMQTRSVAGDDIRVALVGPPNAGKSSLLNALTGDEAAIVSPRAGTTRDYVTRHVDMAGFACLLIDTAGSEAAQGESSVGAHAQAMTAQQADQADVILACCDATMPNHAEISTDSARATEVPQIRVWTKCDLAENPSLGNDREFGDILTSAKTGAGLAQLKNAIREAVQSLEEESAGVLGATSRRARASVVAAIGALERARDTAAQNLGEDIVAAELRGALHALGKVVGAVYTDDILDRIFSRFCIGK